MIVIEVKRAKKHCCEVVFEKESVFLDNETIMLEGVKQGNVYTPEQIETLKYKSEFARAKSKALWLLSRREHSKKELLEKLKPDFDFQPSLEAVELLEQAGVVSDERFAENYAYDLSNFKKLSSSGIKYELIRKGVDREIAEAVSEEYSDENFEKIKEIINLKYNTFSSDEKMKRRMYSALLRKGYSYSDIKKAIDEFEENY